MADWAAHNKKVFRTGLRDYVRTGAQPRIMRTLAQAAGIIRDMVDGGGIRIPVYTGNLHDATGVGVYENGTCRYYVPTKIAKRPQSSGFHYRNVYGIIGAEYLLDAIGEAAKDFSKGIWIVVFSAVPYAFFIDERDGFFQMAIRELVSLIVSGLRPLIKS